MITKVTPKSELKRILTEDFFNNQDKVTKLSDNSVINGHFSGIASLGHKTLKEIALVESNILPDDADSDGLDKIAAQRGIPQRFQNGQSVTYVRVVGDPGTVYNKSTHVAQSLSGLSFSLQENLTLNQHGYGYIKVKSQDVGKKTNVDALTITKISPLPIGHKYITNEVKAEFGRDKETDEQFLKRIKEGPNILSRNTINYLTQAFNKINPNVLRVIYQGKSTNGNTLLAVLSQNGADFSQLELDEIKNKGAEWFSLLDSKTYEQNVIKVDLKNVTYYPIDISFRCKLDESYNPDDIRREIQISLSKIYNPITWNNNRKIEWDDIFTTVKSADGMEYIADQYFYPRIDISVPKNTFPRMRGFQMLDLDGNIITDIQNNLNPFYYPAKVDFNFQKTVLNAI